MKRKIVALLLVVSMLFCLFTGCTSSKTTTTTVSMDGYDITVEQTTNIRTASATVEGVPMKCERNLNTEEYWLYVSDEEPMQLQVEVLDNNMIAVSEVGNTMFLADDEIAGQFVLTLSLAVPALITAAKALICTAACVAVTATVCVAADAIGNVIGGVRSYSSTYRAYRTVDIAAADAIRYGRMNKSNAYYEAYLINNSVFISKEISQWTAVWRLKNGYDVFATTDYAAFSATYQAAIWPGRGGIIKHTYETRDGYYPHYHPVGRKWVNDNSSYPHCWYPV